MDSPDVNVLRESPRKQAWVPPNLFVLPIELVSPSSRKRDRIDKPAMCAAAGIPYFMRIEVDQRLDGVRIDLLRLESGRYLYVRTANAGERFEVDEPLRPSFDPAVLLEP